MYNVLLIKVNMPFYMHTRTSEYVIFFSQMCKLLAEHENILGYFNFTTVHHHLSAFYWVFDACQTFQTHWTFQSLSL